MKKKIVNVLLSVAVVTTMMFTATACGSKDKDNTPVEPAVTNNDDANDNADVDDADAADADDENNDDADAADANDDADAADADGEAVMTVEDWINSEEADTYMQVFDAMFGGAMTTEFEADGNTLAMVFTLSEETLGTDGSDLTDDQKEAAQTLMQEQFDSSRDQFDPMREELQKSITVPDLGLRIVYKTSNGTELFSQDI